MGRLGKFILMGVAALALGGCGSDAEAEDSVYCCALRTAADHCISLWGGSDYRSDWARDWRKVGTGGDADACKAMVDAENLSCYDWGESDAIADCS